MNFIRSNRFVFIPLMLLVAAPISGQNAEQKKEFDPDIVAHQSKTRSKIEKNDE